VLNSYDLPAAHVNFSSNGPDYRSHVNEGWQFNYELRVYGDFITSRINLPPEVPVLGTALPVNLRTPAKSDPFTELFVRTSTEWFFAPLSAVQRSKLLSARYAPRIEAYVGKRSQALAALRAALERPEGAAVVASGCDESVLAALEKDAEDLRTALAREVDNVRWTERSSWEAPAEDPNAADLSETRFLKAVSFFQGGLSPEQRGLLREMSQEAPASEKGRLLTFSPFGARFRLPAGLPQATESLISEYENLKGTLRGELLKAVHENEGTWLEAPRIRHLEALQATQADRFRKLDALAERIRVALAGVTLPDEPPRPMLSSGVSSRLSEYLRSKEAFQRSLVRSLTELRERYPHREISLVREEGKVRVRAKPGFGHAPDKAVTDFTDRIQEEWTELERKRGGISAEIAGELAARGGQHAASIDQMAEDFARALIRQETWARYADYRTAVLRPGLSPRQRQLLFAEAVQSLMPPPAL